MLEFIPSTALLYPPSPDLWNSFSRYHYCIYMPVYAFFALDLPSYPFSPPPLPRAGAKTSPPGQDLFYSSVLWFCRREKIKRKARHFCLFEIKVATQGVSLWYFHVNMFYNHNWFIFFNYLHFTLVPFLCWFQLV
jgi:hypothetical protein